MILKEFYIIKTLKMEKPFENSEKDKQQIGSETINIIKFNDHQENQSIYTKRNNHNYKIYQNNYQENYSKNKLYPYEIIEKEIENEKINFLNNKRLSNPRRYSNEMEVLINNNANFTNYQKELKSINNNEKQMMGTSFKKNENLENLNIINIQENSSKNINANYNNHPNYKNYVQNYNMFNQQFPYTSNNYQVNPNQNMNYRNTNNTNYRNSVKNKSKNINREIKLNSHTNTYNFNNNNFQTNSLNNNSNQATIYNNFTNSNDNNLNMKSNFILHVNDQVSFKNKKKQNFNKIKSKKISKQNNFVNSYDKTNDFTFSKNFFNLNLKFLKQSYKIRDLNFDDYENDDIKIIKGKKNNKRIIDSNTIPEINHVLNKNMFPENVYDGNNFKNCFSSSEEIPSLNFINPYFFNTSQNQALNMYNYNLLSQNLNILNQNLNMKANKNKNNNNNNENDNLNFANNNINILKNLNTIHNPDINYLSDENANYEIWNNDRKNINNLNLNIPFDKTVSQLRIQNQMQMNQYNFYENYRLQSFSSANDPKILEENILSGKFLTGVIRINKCHTHGYITVSGLYNDILIRGNRNLNQSLHLDEVVVELFPVLCWKPLFNKKIRKISYNNKDDNAQQNILNMLRKEAMNNDSHFSKIQANSINKNPNELLIEKTRNKSKSKGKMTKNKKNENSPKEKTLLKSTKNPSDFETFDACSKKYSDKKENQSESIFGKDADKFKSELKNRIGVSEDNDLSIKNSILQTEEDKKQDFLKIENKILEDNNDISSDDEFTDTEGLENDSASESESDEDEKLGNKINIEKNFLLNEEIKDEEDEDEEDYQLYANKSNAINQFNQDLMFDENGIKFIKL